MHQKISYSFQPQNINGILCGELSPIHQQKMTKPTSPRVLQTNRIKHLHQYPTIIHTPQNISTVTQKYPCNFATSNINPISMQLSTYSQENLHMTSIFTTDVTNIITNESKNYKQFIQSNEN